MAGWISLANPADTSYLLTDGNNMRRPEVKTSYVYFRSMYMTV